MENSRSISVNKIPEDVLKQLRTMAALHGVSQRQMVIMLIRERSEAINLDELIRRLKIADESDSPIAEVVEVAS